MNKKFNKETQFRKILLAIALIFVLGFALLQSAYVEAAQAEQYTAAPAPISIGSYDATSATSVSRQGKFSISTSGVTDGNTYTPGQMITIKVTAKDDSAITVTDYFSPTNGFNVYAYISDNTGKTYSTVKGDYSNGVWYIYSNTPMTAGNYKIETYMLCEETSVTTATTTSSTATSVCAKNYGKNAQAMNVKRITVKDVAQYIDTTERVSEWYGKVNNHFDATQNKMIPDADGVSGANLDINKYCTKFYPNTNYAQEYKKETQEWYDRGNKVNPETGKPYTNTVMTYKCIYKAPEYKEPDCPTLMPPGPNFCKDGTIVPGGYDSRGCKLPPTCIYDTYEDLSLSDTINIDQTGETNNGKYKVKVTTTVTNLGNKQSSAFDVALYVDGNFVVKATYNPLSAGKTVGPTNVGGGSFYTPGWHVAKFVLTPTGKDTTDSNNVKTKTFYVEATNYVDTTSRISGWHGKVLNYFDASKQKMMPVPNGVDGVESDFNQNEMNRYCKKYYSWTNTAVKYNYETQEWYDRGNKVNQETGKPYTNNVITYECVYKDIDTNALPDLIVSNIRVTPTNPKVGDRIHVYATIKNIGTGPVNIQTTGNSVPALTVGITSNNKYQGAFSDGTYISTEPLSCAQSFGNYKSYYAPGESYEEEICGSYIYKFTTTAQDTLTLDVNSGSNRDVVESNYNNNKLTKTIGASSGRLVPNIELELKDSYYSTIDTAVDVYVKNNGQNSILYSTTGCDLPFKIQDHNTKEYLVINDPQRICTAVMTTKEIAPGTSVLVGTWDMTEYKTLMRTADQDNINPRDFRVQYFGYYTSGGGDRILNITYRVLNNEIVSCDGTYRYPAPVERRGQSDIEQCNVNKLIARQYNVPLNLTTEIGQETSGEYHYRTERYSWKILEDNDPVYMKKGVLGTYDVVFSYDYANVATHTGLSSSAAYKTTKTINIYATPEDNNSGIVDNQFNIIVDTPDYNEDTYATDQQIGIKAFAKDFNGELDATPDKGFTLWVTLTDTRETDAQNGQGVLYESVTGTYVNGVWQAFIQAPRNEGKYYLNMFLLCTDNSPTERRSCLDTYSNKQSVYSMDIAVKNNAEQRTVPQPVIAEDNRVQTFNAQLNVPLKISSNAEYSDGMSFVLTDISDDGSIITAKLYDATGHEDSIIVKMGENDYERIGEYILSIIKIVPEKNYVKFQLKYYKDNVKVPKLYIGDGASNGESGRIFADNTGSCAGTGCLVNNQCVNIGIRAKDTTGKIPLYCDLDGSMKEQKKDGADCDNDYECYSNSCSSGTCINLNAQITQNNNLLQKILSWFGLK